MKPYEREHLADPIMAFDRNPVSSTYLDHVFESREGARGATGGGRRRLRMQLMRRAERRIGSALQPFARTARCAVPGRGAGAAGVLPEDRADVLYHHYDGGGITVEGPSVLVRKKIGDTSRSAANYYQDMISSASIDVLLSASPYHETRTQKSVSADYLHGKTTYSAGYINSKEPDYKANTAYYSVSQDMFGDLTTVTLGYRRGWDRVFRDIKTDGVIVNDPTFHQRADHRVYGLSLTQILTRNSSARSTTSCRPTRAISPTPIARSATPTRTTRSATPWPTRSTRTPVRAMHSRRS